MTANPGLFDDEQPPKPTQTDRFQAHLQRKLEADTATVNLFDVYAAQPDCPSEVRLLSLLTDPLSEHILEQNEMHLGDNPSEKKLALGRFLAAEQQQENQTQKPEGTQT